MKMAEQEEFTRFLPDIRDYRRSLTQDEEVNEKEEGVKNNPQVRALFFLPSEFSQLLIL